MMNQVKSGKAFEYGMMKAFSHMLNCTIQRHSALIVARDCYNNCDFEEQNKILYSSRKAILFLLRHDNRLTNGLYNVVLQLDTKGIQGDVRDIIVYDVKRVHEIGLSLKIDIRQ